MVKSVVTLAEHRQRVQESAERLERLKAERDRLDDAIASGEEWHERHREAAARAGFSEAGLKRSTMTALQKSRIIGEHGSEAYFAIPWD
jgi:septal ring factor EnvC (AmiA/AmiB activator)